MGLRSNHSRCSLSSVIVVALLAAAVMLSGCVAADGPPKYTRGPLGAVCVSTRATASPDPGQTLTEAGVYFSPNRDAVVSVCGTSATTSGQISLVETLGVEKVTIPASGTIAPSRADTLSTNLTGLKPATTYYYRFYTLGVTTVEVPFPPYTPQSVPVASALKVGSFKTASAGTIGNPVAPSRMYPGRAATIYGSLKPRHASGTSPVRVYRWKRTADNKWQAYGYVWAKVSSYSSYSRYSKSMSFSKGTWRLRALHPAHSDHGSIWSPGFDYVSVR